MYANESKKECRGGLEPQKEQNGDLSSRVVARCLLRYRDIATQGC